MPSPQTSTLPSDYDVVDPYVADRLEAMKQLYPDDFPAEGSSSPPSPNPNFLKIPKAPEHQTFHRYRMHAARSFSESLYPSETNVPNKPLEMFKWAEKPDYDMELLSEIRNGLTAAESTKPDGGEAAEAANPELPDDASSAGDQLEASDTKSANEEQVPAEVTTTPRYVYPWLEDPNFDDNLAKGVYGDLYRNVLPFHPPSDQVQPVRLNSART